MEATATRLGGTVSDRTAFADLVRPHWSTMAALARRLSPPGDGDDVLQDALSDAWRKRGQYDPDRGSARNWLLAIVADQARKSRRRIRPVVELQDVADEGATPEIDVDLRAALRELTHRQRSAVVLHGEVDAVRRPRPAAHPARGGLPMSDAGGANDIEERLRRDAATRRHEDSEPDFDAALDRVAPVRRARRPRTAWLALAAAVVAIGAVVAAVLAWPSLHRVPAGGDRRYADYLSDSNQPQQDLRWQQVNHIDFSVVVRVPGEPNRLRVLITGNDGGECSIRRPRIGSVTQNSTSVQVNVTGEELLPKPDRTGDISFACAQSSTQVIGASLGAPLGDRTVASDAGADAAAVLDPAELPTPSYLPDGYQAAGVQPLRIADNKLTAERDYQRGTDRIIVVVGERDQMPADGQPVAGHLDVGGAPATITKASGTCLTWTIRPSVQTAVCSIGHPDAAVSLTTLAEVARSLH